MGKIDLPHIKSVNAKGRTYHYFCTGRLDANGREVRVRLPDPGDPSFGRRYAELKALRNRQAPAAAMTIGQLAELYLSSPAFTHPDKRQRHAESTIREYTRILGKAVDLLSPAPAAAIAPSDIVALHDRLAAAPAMANQTVRVLSAMFAWAGPPRAYVPVNPCQGIELNKGGTHAPWPELMLEAALASTDPVVRRIVHLLYFTGQRVGDCLAMTRTGSIASGRLSVVQQKTGKLVDIPLHASLAAELERGPRHAALIVDTAGKVPSRDGVRRLLQAWAKASGAKVRPVPHGLRKNAVNALLDVGCSIAEISAITGQTLRLVEDYAKGRNQRRHADSAVLKWERKG